MLEAGVCHLWALPSPSVSCVCPDVNECSQKNGGCNQICYNKPGSFHCACYSGYVLSQDSRSCRGKALDLGPSGCPGPLSSSPSCPLLCSSFLLLLQLPGCCSWQSRWLLCKRLLAVAAAFLEGREGGRRGVLQKEHMPGHVSSQGPAPAPPPQHHRHRMIHSVCGPGRPAETEITALEGVRLLGLLPVPRSLQAFL